jgi:anti-anti-sigma regulatory factor
LKACHFSIDLHQDFRFVSKDGCRATAGDCMLKIERSANGRVVFKLSGRIEAEDVKELRELLAMETTGQQLVLDLRDVTLVNQDAVKFLDSCEADRIMLENCPPYIRKWIEQAKDRTRRRRKR